MQKSKPLNKQIEEDESVLCAEYDPSENTLTVTHEPSDGSHAFSEREVKAIRQGKLTPLTAGIDSTTYDVHITLDEQRQARASKFTFSA